MAAAGAACARRGAAQRRPQPGARGGARSAARPRPGTGRGGVRRGRRHGRHLRGAAPAGDGGRRIEVRPALAPDTLGGARRGGGTARDDGVDASRVGHAVAVREPHRRRRARRHRPADRSVHGRGPERRPGNRPRGTGRHGRRREARAPEPRRLLGVRRPLARDALRRRPDRRPAAGLDGRPPDAGRDVRRRRRAAAGARASGGRDDARRSTRRGGSPTGSRPGGDAGTGSRNLGGGRGARDRRVRASRPG